MRKTLDELCTNITDGKHGDCKPQNNSNCFFISCKDVIGGKIVYDKARQITSSDYLDSNKRTRLDTNDILLTNSGTIGRMAFIKDVNLLPKTTFQKSVAIIKPDANKIHPKYLYYKILSEKTSLENNAGGTAQKNLLLRDIRSFEINIHNNETQKKIADILSAYDDLIENNQMQIKLLEESAMRLYKEWFVYLRFPDYENTEIVDGLPVGWEKFVFSDKVEIMSGGTPKTSNSTYYEGAIPFYSPKDSDDKFFSFDTKIHISEAGLKNCNSKLYPINTIIITARGTVGKVTLLGNPMAMNQSCYALKSKYIDSPYYLFLALKNEISALKGMANGGVFDTIIVNTFSSIYITIPDEKILSLFKINVNSYFGKINILSKQIILLKQARDKLLPKLMNGEIEV